MKQLMIALVVLMCSFAAHSAVRPVIPDESSPVGLSPVIPCVNATYKGIPYISCDWYDVARDITVWDAQEQRNKTYSNRVQGSCIQGTCRTSGGLFGHWKEDTQFILQAWYYISESEDGQPIAYLTNTGPDFGGRSVTYLEAAVTLYNFYKSIGLDDITMKNWFGERYEGGYDKFLVDADLLKPQTSEVLPKTEVKTAWCSQDLDDDCTIDGKKVLKTDLNKYLPSVNPDEVTDTGGYCEYPICYDENDKPIGITR